MGILLFRLDDVTPWQNWEKFERLHELFRKYQIAPVIGVVPDNCDPKLCIGDPRKDFAQYLNKLVREEGWVIAQHGFTHTYVNKNGGMLKVNRQSEFAGLPYDEQFDKLKKGQEFLQKQGLCATMFMAPAHTYDKSTLRALQKLGFTWVTDGYTDHVYRRFELVFIPCTVSKPIVPKESVVNTVCYHPNMMTEEEFIELEQFLEKHAEVCKSFDWYLEHLSQTQIPHWNVYLWLEQLKNRLLRCVKHIVAENALCQRLLQARACARSGYR